MSSFEIICCKFVTDLIINICVLVYWSRVSRLGRKPSVCFILNGSFWVLLNVTYQIKHFKDVNSWEKKCFGTWFGKNTLLEHRICCCLSTQVAVVYNCGLIDHCGSSDSQLSLCQSRMKQKKRHQGNLSCCSTNVKVAILPQHLCQLLQQQTKSRAIKLHFILYFKFAGTSFPGTSHFITWGYTKYIR